MTAELRREQRRGVSWLGSDSHSPSKKHGVLSTHLETFSWRLNGCELKLLSDSWDRRDVSARLGGMLELLLSEAECRFSRFALWSVDLRRSRSLRRRDVMGAQGLGACMLVWKSAGWSADQ